METYTKQSLDKKIQHLKSTGVDHLTNEGFNYLLDLIILFNITPLNIAFYTFRQLLDSNKNSGYSKIDENIRTSIELSLYHSISNTIYSLIDGFDSGKCLGQTPLTINAMAQYLKRNKACYTKLDMPEKNIINIGNKVSKKLKFIRKSPEYKHVKKFRVYWSHGNLEYIPTSIYSKFEIYVDKIILNINELINIITEGLFSTGFMFDNPAMQWNTNIQLFNYYIELGYMCNKALKSFSYGKSTFEEAINKLINRVIIQYPESARKHIYNSFYDKLNDVKASDQVLSTIDEIERIN